LGAVFLSISCKHNSKTLPTKDRKAVWQAIRSKKYKRQTNVDIVLGASLDPRAIHFPRERFSVL
jgi:hypothetical protein